MTMVPDAGGELLTVVCDSCGQTVDGVESSAEHWPVVWALITRQGWGGSPGGIGPHHCPDCAATSLSGHAAARGDQEWGASLVDHEHACVVRLRGQLDLLFAGELRDVLVAAAERHRNVVLDLADVRLLDSTGLGQLVQARQLVEAKNGQLCLVAPSTFIVTVLETTRLFPVFEIFSRTAAALAWLARTPAAPR
ncbi:MAG TPA: STAS domain-containing protein [Pilimelia sp.]|nr:STAS domain-containing protein [Pilimelia sp.]